ncbi:MAG: YchJ family metal-binding protein [Actinomycetota bacterium]|nr:YchJ family metal-binding protein [Actinomycetota bacterium]
MTTTAAGVIPTDPCPCGSGQRLGACCGPYLAGELLPTAEATMRSRYTSYVLGDRDHLLRTWHPRTRPRQLDVVGRDDGWLGLTVLGARDGGVDDETGVVEFEARHRGSDRPDDVEVMHEVSRFARRGGRWVYVDADG